MLKQLLMITRETWARQHWSGTINRLPERSGDARDFERDKASAQQAISPVSPEHPAQSKASGLWQTYKV